VQQKQQAQQKWQERGPEGVAIVRALLAYPAIHVNAVVSTDHRPAVISAIMSGHHDIASLLVAHEHTLLSLKDANGCTPYWWAMLQGNLELAAQMAQCGRPCLPEEPGFMPHHGPGVWLTPLQAYAAFNTDANVIDATMNSVTAAFAGAIMTQDDKGGWNIKCGAGDDLDEVDRI